MAHVELFRQLAVAVQNPFPTHLEGRWYSMRSSKPGPLLDAGGIVEKEQVDITGKTRMNNRRDKWRSPPIPQFQSLIRRPLFNSSYEI